jgi:glutamyl-Q tRNA(Asp) synthetase
MEDLDPPRESPEAARQILDSLVAHGLVWDDDVLWQSRRHDAYGEVVEKLLARGQAFRCDCTRAQLKSQGNVYHGRCRQRRIAANVPAAVRVRVSGTTRIRVEDRIQPPLVQDLAQTVGDFIVKRKDSLFAYQLAVVLDDAWQGVTEVVRGFDLYDSTPRQIYLQRLLGLPTPRYAHIPVITNALGQKLSKQNCAPPIDNARAVENLRLALRFLGQPAPASNRRRVEALLEEAIARWDPDAITRAEGIPQNSLH